MALKDKAKKSGTLKTRAKKRTPKIGLNHPTMDSPESSTRTTYNPPVPEERFQFLKTFATIPALRTRGAQQPPQ